MSQEGQDQPSTDGNDGSGRSESGSEQAKLSPWESPSRSHSTETPETSASDTGSTPVDADTDADPDSVDWTRRELGDSYPVEKNYHCNACNDFAADSISDLQAHIGSHDDITWSEYLETTNLHRCAGCGEGLETLGALYCESCIQQSGDRIPCRNCGEVRVKVSDPFCSAACAGERMTATDGGPPLDPPVNPDSTWLDHPHRLETGLPAAAPFIANHRLVCRECYEYGSDNLHDFAVHVSEKHDFGWAGYIKKYELRRCRVCEDPLESLLPLYCSDACQRSDPDPIRTCARDRCGAAVERRQKYCSRDCFLEDKDV